ncbi:MAG: galactokinase [Clostridia bacterium]|nr:galactokinase [Clostridia bacterium]
MNTSEMIGFLQGGGIDARLVTLYGKKALPRQRARYEKAVAAFERLYGKAHHVRVFSVSGRSELLGNHTDHNHGCVLAAAVDLDIIAVAAAVNDTVVRVTSEGYPEDVVDISDFTSPREAHFSKSDALIAGMCHGFQKNGHRVGGFVAYTTSNVPKGSGLSSSAAFEVMIGNIQNHLYNNGNVDNKEIATIAQYAENVFFGKPCGLMDQMACAVGGIVAIDFANNKHPVVEDLTFDLAKRGYVLSIVNTGGNHADLTPDYAAVPAEMKAVATAMGKAVLSEVSEQTVIAALPRLRESVGDRAVLRALHFFGENRRVAAGKAALAAGDLELFFEIVRASGRSSFCYLQNVYTTKNVAEQGLSLALCLAERFLENKEGAWRVHGGGFAGTVQAFTKQDNAEEFAAMMNAVFGKNACMTLTIRPEGAIAVI